MKIAITSTGNTLESTLDQHFGRCDYFIIYDTEMNSLEFIPNPNKNIGEDAGIMAVNLVGSKGVNKVISGEFGLKIKPLFDSMKIQMIVLKQPEKKINEIIQMLNH